MAKLLELAELVELAPVDDAVWAPSPLHAPVITAASNQSPRTTATSR